MELSSDYQLLPFAINWKDGSSGYQSRREDITHGLRLPIPGLGCPRCGWDSQTVGGPRRNSAGLNSRITAIQYHIEPVFLHIQYDIREDDNKCGRDRHSIVHRGMPRDNKQLPEISR